MNATAELTFLETQWLTAFEHAEYPALKVTVYLFALYQIVFLGRYLPFFVLDYFKLLQQYKLQPDKPFSSEQWWTCMKQITLDQYLLHLPMMFAFYPVAMYLGMEFLTVPLPSTFDLALQSLFFMVCEDCYQYFMHRLLHWGPFYKHIHKMHHNFSAPFGICAEYAHPAETVILGLGFFLGPLIWCSVAKMHIFTMFVWLAVRLLQTVDAHSGYDFPWSLRNIIFFWAGAEFHDYHHRAFVGNYGSFFRFWDYVCGTSNAFYDWKKKEALKAKLD